MKDFKCKNCGQIIHQVFDETEIVCKNCGFVNNLNLADEEIKIDYNILEADACYDLLEKYLVEGNRIGASKVLERLEKIEEPNAKLYLYKCFFFNNIKGMKGLDALTVDISGNPLFKKALELADGDLKIKLDGLTQIVKNNKHKSQYDQALKFMENSEYEKAQKILQSMPDYENSNELLEKLDLLIIEDAYAKASLLYQKREYKSALECFEKIEDYSNSKEKILEIKQILKVNEELILYKQLANENQPIDSNKLLDLLEKSVSANQKSEIKKLIDKNRKNLKESKKKKLKKGLAWGFGSSIIGLAVLFSCLTIFVFVPEHKMDLGIKCIERGNYSEAIERLEKLNYGNSANLTKIAEAAVLFKEGRIVGGINKVVEAKGVVNAKYNKSFDADSLDMLKVTYNEKVSKVEQPFKEGYTFERWNVENIKVNLSSKPMSINLSLKNIFHKTKYTITYQNLKTYEDSGLPNEYFELEGISIPNVGNRYEQTFEGWSFNNSLPKRDYVIPSGNIGDVTLLAVWDKTNTKVHVDYNCPEFESETLTIYKETPYNFGTPTRKGYTFDGWYEKSGDSLVKIDNEGNWSRDQIETYIVAKWTPIKYNINYLNLFNAKNPNEPCYTIADEDINILPPIRNGYKFLGWTLPDQTEPSLTFVIPKESTEEFNLTAHWEALEYNITYHLNGGQTDGEFINKYTSDSTVSLPKVTKPNQYFAGWSLTPDGESLSNGSIVLDYGNVNLYAIYGNDVKVTLSRSYGEHFELTDPVNVTYFDEYNGDYFHVYNAGEKIQNPTPNKVDGKYFAGWSTVKGDPKHLYQFDERVTGELKLYAVYSDIDVISSYSEIEFTSDKHYLSDYSDRIYITVNFVGEQYYFDCNLHIGNETHHLGYYNHGHNYYVNKGDIVYASGKDADKLKCTVNHEKVPASSQIESNAVVGISEYHQDLIINLQYNQPYKLPILFADGYNFLNWYLYENNEKIIVPTTGDAWTYSGAECRLYSSWERINNK